MATASTRLCLSRWRKGHVIRHQYSICAKACLCLTVACVLVITASGAVVAIHDWDSTGEGAWSSSNGWANVSEEATSGGDEFLSITFTNTYDEEGNSSWEDIIYAPATSLFAGTYSVSNWFAFDFWASNVLPSSLQVRWGSTNSSKVWGSTIAGPTVTGEWQTLTSASLSNWDEWDQPFATYEQFKDDLASIEWVGIYIDRRTDVEQMYGVDNFALMVPEPGELVMLAFAMVAVLTVYRRKDQQATVRS
jgi:hypothetical protein